MNRDDLRRLLKQKRLQLTEAFQLEAEKRVFSHILQSNLLNEAKHIACYMPINGEVGTQLLINFLWEQNKQVYLPKITGNKNLLFIEYNKNTILEKNKFNIWEPGSNASSIVAEGLDLIFLPLLGFDNHGNRLGTGQGYYDRSFTFKLNDPKIPPSLVGLAYSFQKLEKLAAESWDVKLDYLITEEEIISI